MLEQVFSFTTLSSTVLLSIPYILAALGGTSSERSGVVNIALEGMLTAGAFAAAAVTWWTASPWAGLLAALAAGVIVSSLHALVTVTVKADQIITGLAINLLVAGGTKFGMQLLWAKAHSDPIRTLPWLWTPPKGAGGLTTLMHTLTGQPIVILTVALVAAVTFFHTRTVTGLRIRAVGENPDAADTMGLSVPGLRYAGLLLSGALAGLGGAWLTFNVSQFSEGLSAGKGYIAMAAVVFGRWRPVGATAGCLLFGLSGAIAEALERGGATSIPSELIGTLPYVLTIVVLAGFIGHAQPPRSLGVPYEKGAH